MSDWTMWSLGHYMTIAYQDNFDGETADTAPDNWVNDPSRGFATFLVKNDQYHSSPNSMYLGTGTSGDYKSAHHNLASTFNTNESMTCQVKSADTTSHKFVFRNYGSTGGWSGGGAVPCQFWLGATGHIYYYAYPANVDSGYDYDTNWHEYKLTWDFINSIVYYYFDGSLCGHGHFSGSGASDIKSIGMAAHITGTGDMWVDDIQIGDTVPGQPQIKRVQLIEGMNSYNGRFW
jgi:hypothetical protein